MILNNADIQDEGTLIFPSDLFSKDTTGNLNYDVSHPYTRIKSFEYIWETKGTQSSFQKQPTSGSIILPLSESGLMDMNSHNWEEVDLFNFADAGDATMWNIVKKYGVDKFRSFSGDWWKYFKKGKFFNDYMSLSYNGTAMRSFMFSWSLTPKSLSEAIIVQKILYRIKRDSLYSMSSDENSSVDDYILDYPRIFQIDIIMPGNKKLVNIQNCVIQNYMCNYAPEGIMNVFRSGHPIKIQLDLTFKELIKKGREGILDDSIGRYDSGEGQ